MKETLDMETRRSIVAYRIESAHNAIDDAKYLLSDDRLNATANRLYYACYYIVEALLISNGIQASTHQGVKSMFGAHLVLKGKVDIRWSKYFSAVLSLRKTADYDFFVKYEKDDIEPLLSQADEFMTTIEQLIPPEMKNLETKNQLIVDS